jgi:hypothetical protein
MEATPLEDRIERGRLASEVLENELFIEAFESTERELVERWKSSPARDSEGREKIWVYLSMLRKVRANLESAMETGELGKIELNHRASAAERVRSIFG